MFRQVLPTSVATFLVLFSLAACTKPNAPTTQNFTKAIRTDMQQRPYTYAIALDTPQSTSFGPLPSNRVLYDQKIYVPAKKALQNTPNGPQEVTIFSIDEKNPLLKDKVWCDFNKDIGIHQCHLIFGRYVFDKILSSTAPATTSDGRIVSHLKVRFKPAFNPLKEILHAFIAQDIGTPVVGKMILIQENNGWKVDTKSFKSLK